MKSFTNNIGLMQINKEQKQNFAGIKTFATILLLIIFSSIVFAMASINPVAEASQSAEAAVSQEFANQTTEAYQYLSSQEAVKKITPIQSDVFAEKYLFTVEQPLDWNNPNGEKFTQRVLLCVRDVNALNFLNLEGYDMLDRFISKDEIEKKEYEMCQKYNGNFILIEHRFFAESAPANLDPTKKDKWEYLTTANAANDQHHIFEILKPLMPNKWTSQGFSKGGETVILYEYYWPNDMDVSVAYVWPLSEFEDKRGLKFVYEEAGDVKYGKEKAAQLRQLCLDLQVEYFAHKDVLFPLFKDYMERKGLKYSTDVFGDKTLHVIYETDVLFMPWGQWQYFEEWGRLQQINDLSWQTQREEKAKQLCNLIWDSGDSKKSRLKFYNDPTFPYDVQTKMELGDYAVDFSYLRTELAKHSLSPVTTDAMEYQCMNSFRIPQELRNSLTYDPTAHNGVKNWIKNTDSKIINIYGSSDPWYAMRVDDVLGKPNIKTYVSHTDAHSACIGNIEPDDANEAWATLDAWLSNNPIPDPPNNEEKETASWTPAKTYDSTFDFLWF